MEQEQKYNLYDIINTTAVRWLQYNSQIKKCPLGIKNFGRINYIHMWLLHQIRFNSIYNGYEDYYIDSSWYDYLYLRFIKKWKHLKKANKKSNVCLIDIDIFCDELIAAYNNEHEDAKISNCIFEYIYKDYYKEKKYG